MFKNSHGVLLPFNDVYGAVRKQPLVNDITSLEILGYTDPDEEITYDESIDDYISSPVCKVGFTYQVPELGLAVFTVAPLCTLISGYQLDQYGVDDKEVVVTRAQGTAVNLQVIAHDYIPDSSFAFLVLPATLEVDDLEDWYIQLTGEPSLPEEIAVGFEGFDGMTISDVPKESCSDYGDEDIVDYYDGLTYLGDMQAHGQQFLMFTVGSNS